MGEVGRLPPFFSHAWSNFHVLARNYRKEMPRIGVQGKVKDGLVPSITTLRFSVDYWFRRRQRKNR